MLDEDVKIFLLQYLKSAKIENQRENDGIFRVAMKDPSIDYIISLIEGDLNAKSTLPEGKEMKESPTNTWELAEKLEHIAKLLKEDHTQQQDRIIDESIKCILIEIEEIVDNLIDNPETTALYEGDLGDFNVLLVCLKEYLEQSQHIENRRL